MFRAVGGNAPPESEREKKIVGMWEFNEDWKKGLVGRDINDEILEEQVGDFYEMENHELEEQVNSAIAESQLEKRQYKLAQGNGKYSIERSKKAIEQEMPGMRQEMHKEKLITVTGRRKGSRNRSFRNARGIY